MELKLLKMLFFKNQRKLKFFLTKLMHERNKMVALIK